MLHLALMWKDSLQPDISFPETWLCPENMHLMKYQRHKGHNICSWDIQSHMKPRKSTLTQVQQVGYDK